MRKLAVLCIGLLSLTLFVGCGDNDAADSDSGASGRSFETAAPAVAPPGFREQAPGDSKQQPSGEVLSRKEVVTGSVDIIAGDPIAAAGQVAGQVTAAGGRIDSRTEQPGTDDDDRPSASLTVRVPADKTDAFIDGLGKIGEVAEISTNRDDVTMQWEDLDARIKALQASVDRLRALIAGANNTADLIAAEQALSSRQGELDSLTAQKRRLDDQVALSTLTISLRTDADHSDDGPSNFWDGIVEGWNSLVGWLQDAVVFLGKAIPWLGFLVLLGAALWGLVKLIRRPRRPRHTVGPEASAPAETVAGTGESRATDSGKGDRQAEQP
ncbi:DUF4349 domain-containing protein [Nocardia goodfellowii]|uniref:DUF4349 domain-containing protein n=1 Tax=Nocardia goodfellowii TaxID=882446 RepID=A0ABS4Q858_9NOCA|nr:DUF4349 domain-containing protein [Nocardia goodfellowii]MBP2187283.1 hypothetical protein [Nocardia goodfellowii]